MVDIHTHILPGLDDGAESMGEALDMLSAAADSDVNHIIATSHGNYYSYSLEEYEEAFERLCSGIRKYNIPVTLYRGMEIFLDENALDRIEQKELLTLNDTDYLLVEFPFDEKIPVVIHRLLELKEAGYKPILAHPERYYFMQDDPDLAFFLYEEGIYLQCNTGSLLGDFGSHCQDLSNYFLQRGIVHVAASDAHDFRRRSTSMQRFASYMRRYYSSYEFRILLSENPSRILKGYPLLNLKEERR